MKKLMSLVMAVVLMAVMSMVVTGCNKYDRKEAYTVGLEAATTSGLMVWDVHEYYGFNNYNRATMYREWCLKHNKVCTKIENNNGVYWFKTLYIAG
jgi:hypothetical protein